MDIKLKCIKSIRYLTKGTYYKVKFYTHNLYWVYKDDLNQGGFYEKNLFQTLEDNRNEKIDDIIIG